LAIAIPPAPLEGVYGDKAEIAAGMRELIEKWDSALSSHAGAVRATKAK